MYFGGKPGVLVYRGHPQNSLQYIAVCRKCLTIVNIYNNIWNANQFFIFFLTNDVIALSSLLYYLA